MRLGLGLGIGMLTQAPIAGPPWTPASLSNLLSWHRGDMGITLSATLRATGTTPPAITISGTLAQNVDLWLDMPVGGARGTAQFRYSTDGGVTYSAQILTAASVALGTTGITANFPIGTYSTDNLYKSVIATWADQSGNAKNVSQANATLQFKNLVTSANLNNQAAVLCDATSGLLSASFNQTVKEVFIVATYPATTFSTFNVAFQAITLPLVRGDSGTANFRAADYVGTRYRNNVLTDAALTVANAKHFYRQIITTPVASTGYRIGGDGGASREWRGEIAEIITLSSTISAGELTSLHSYISSRYGITIA